MISQCGAGIFALDFPDLHRFSQSFGSFPCCFSGAIAAYKSEDAEVEVWGELAVDNNKGLPFDGSSGSSAVLHSRSASRGDIGVCTGSQFLAPPMYSQDSVYIRQAAGEVEDWSLRLKRGRSKQSCLGALDWLGHTRCLPRLYSQFNRTATRKIHFQVVLRLTHLHRNLTLKNQAPGTGEFLSD